MLYPEIGLERSLFQHALDNHNTWTTESQRRWFFDQFAKTRNFDPLVPQNWYSIVQGDVLQKHGGAAVLSYYNRSHTIALQTLYPDIGLNSKLFSARKIQQRSFQGILSKLFPKEEVIYNARKVVQVMSAARNYLEIDVWFPRLKLGFEYQEKHHYMSAWYSNDSIVRYNERDALKEEEMRKKHYTLIIVPCWWDGAISSLIASIWEKRPDLLCQHIVEDNNQGVSKFGLKPIPKAPPPGFFDVAEIPHVGELTLPSFVSSKRFDPSNWWMGEKFDGIRACWIPINTTIYSKQAKHIGIHKKILDMLPPILLDGEIWYVSS